jgi:hypothetical protein
MSLLVPSFASSSRTRLPSAISLALGRRSKADKGAGATTGKKAGGPPVDHGDSSTDTLKRVRPSKLLLDDCYVGKRAAMRRTGGMTTV